jgi:hypothetical protein
VSEIKPEAEGRLKINRIKKLEFFICEEHSSIDFWVQSHTYIDIYPFGEMQNVLGTIAVKETITFWLNPFSRKIPFIEGKILFSSDRFSSVKLLHNNPAWTLLVDSQLDGENIFPVKLPRRYYN